MAKEKQSSVFSLREGETLLGRFLMHYRGGGYGGEDGVIFVTEERLSFHALLTNFCFVELPIREITGYGKKRIMLTPFLTLYTESGEEYDFSGLYRKKLIALLEQLGIPRLS